MLLPRQEVKKVFLAEKIKELREAKRLSQEGLMFELDKVGLRLSRQTLFNWENGINSPDATDIAIIANYFKKPIQYFFDQKQ